MLDMPFIVVDLHAVTGSLGYDHDKLPRKLGDNPSQPLLDIVGMGCYLYV